jgi:hypothetical protein
MKISFIFHFIIGAIVFSNEKILSKKGIGSKLIESWGSPESQGILSFNRYNSIHVLIFVIGNLIILILALFEHTIFSYLVSTVSCFSDMQEKFNKMEAISDDYYEEMNFKFLITEYERAKFEK